LVVKPNFKKNLNDNLNLDKEKTINKKFFYSALALAAIAGGATAYFKIQADNANDKAKRFAELGQIGKVEKYADRTDKYDIYAGVSFGIMQVNFLGLVYFVLK